MRVYLKEGKLCIPSATSRRDQNATAYYFYDTKQKMLVRLTALMYSETCIKPFFDDMLIIATYTTIRDRSLLSTIYRYNNNKLTFIARIDNVTANDINNILKELGLDVDERLLKELGLAQQQQQVVLN